jgi:hypothetical protein
MAFLIGGANTLATGDFITNSLRISPSDDGFLERTTSGVADSNRKTWTFSWWAKLSVGVEQHLYGFRVNADNMSYLRLNSDGQMRWANEDYSGTTGSPNVLRVQTNRYFRDASAWYHIVLRADTTQATETDRIRFYINGVEETSMSSTDYPSQNFDIEINEPDNFIIGAMRNTNGTTTGQVDGYLSEVHFVDGQSYAPTVFGEYNDNGVWIPKDCKSDITYGTRGFYMQFQQTGTNADASGIGADTSGNGNHFTPNNLVAADITTDIPTNNFATLNPLNSSASATLSEGNTKHTNDGGNDQASASTMSFANGKWYWEVKIVDKGEIGINLNSDTLQLSNDSSVGSNDDNFKITGLITNSAGGSNDFRHNGSTESITSVSVSDNDIISIAVDADNSKIWFAKNGTYFNSGDPAAGSNEAKDFSGAYTSGNFITPVGLVATGDGDILEYNFGNPHFSISSGNADENGYGNFEYAVPSGYYALCTKNLAEYG